MYKKSILFLSKILLLFAFYTIFLYHYSFALEDDSAPMTEEKLYGKCKSAYAEGNFSDASQYVGEFLSLYPESSYSGEILFMQAFLQPDIDESIEIYSSIIEKYPDSPWTAKSHFQLGQCYYLQGAYDRALNHYGKIIVSYTDDDSYWPARYWKCKSLIGKGGYEEAITALRSLEGNGSGGVGKDMILMSLGECYFGMKDYENAANSYKSLIESLPDSDRLPTAYLSLAKSYQSMEKLEEAKQSCQKLIESYPQSMELQQAQQILGSLRHETSDSRLQSPVSSLKVQPSASEPVDIPEEKPEPSAETKVEPESYFCIQVGAFSSKPVAEKLANQLRRKGYYVDVLDPFPGGKTLYRVRVGKFKTRSAELLETERKLRRQEKLPVDIIYNSPTS
jgi:TolA-binding protein